MEATVGARMSTGERTMAIEHCCDRLTFLIRRRTDYDEAQAREAATRLLAFTLPEGDPVGPGDVRRIIVEMRRRYAPRNGA